MYGIRYTTFQKTKCCLMFRCFLYSSPCIGLSGTSRQLHFDRHWASIFGSRWPSLHDALMRPTEHVAWMNPFVSHREPFGKGFLKLQHSSSTVIMMHPSGAPAFRAMPSPTMVLTEQTTRSLCSHYLLDGASPLPALLLAPRRGHRVLDLCAAPGGKSLILAGQMFNHSSAALEDDA